MDQFKLPEGIGYIVRTAALKRNKKVLSRDLNRLLRMWKDIRKRVSKVPPLSLIHKEEDVCLRTLRDYFTSEITEVLVDDKETYGKVKNYMKVISPRHQRRIKLYKKKRPIFTDYEIEKQIESIHSNEVRLKSGGYIVIDPTEALISIDVNSGRGRSGISDAGSRGSGVPQHQLRHAEPLRSPAHAGGDRGARARADRAHRLQLFRIR